MKLFGKIALASNANSAVMPAYYVITANRTIISLSRIPNEHFTTTIIPFRKTVNNKSLIINARFVYFAWRSKSPGEGGSNGRILFTIEVVRSNRRTLFPVYVNRNGKVNANKNVRR